MAPKPSGREEFMRRALALAARGFGRVSPNPMVGAVVVRGGEVVGEGYHLFETRDHAEVVALHRAGPKARGSDLYLNLEPCSHFGRTPPCVERIVESGIRRVFAAMPDPNPLVRGSGFDYLRERGIVVETGLLEERARRLNVSYCYFIRTTRPFATLKLAMSLDGRIACRSGDSKWITGEKARSHVHRIRFGSDALLVGINTVLKDDPRLDVRWRRRNSIVRVILDSNLRCPPEARLFEVGDPVLLVHGPDASKSRRRLLAGRASLLEVPRGPDGLAWDVLLTRLGEEKISSLIIEGGGKVAASALRAGVVQQTHFYYGPLVIGGDGIGGIGSLSLDRLSRAPRFQTLRIRRLGEDYLFEGEVILSGPEKADCRP